MSTPAQHVIAKCGGHQRVADMLGVHVSTVHRFSYSRDSGGRGGYVPARYQQQLLDKARSAGIDLRPDDFFHEATQ